MSQETDARLARSKSEFISRWRSKNGLAYGTGNQREKTMEEKRLWKRKTFSEIFFHQKLFFFERKSVWEEVDEGGVNELERGVPFPGLRRASTIFSVPIGKTATPVGPVQSIFTSP